MSDFKDWLSKQDTSTPAPAEAAPVQTQQGSDFKSWLAAQNQPQANIKPVETTSPKDSTILADSGFKPGSTFMERLQEGLERASVGAQAFNVGVEAIGNTVAKGLSKGLYATLPAELSKHIPSAQQYQNVYDKRVDEYKTNRAANPDLPLGGLNLAGTVGASMAIPGANLYKGAGALGKAAFGGVGKVAGNILGGAVAGGLAGGAISEQGQGSDVMNPSNMKTGAIMGGVLGPVQGFISRNVDDLPAYMKTKEQLNSTVNGQKVSFDAPIFDATPQYTAGTVDNMLQKMPSYLGTNNYLSQTKEELRPFVTKVINAVSNKTVGESTDDISRAITSQFQGSKKLYNQTWEALPAVYKDAGITKIPTIAKDRVTTLINSLNAIDDKSVNNIGQNLSKIANKKDLSVKDLISIKQDIWKQRTYLNKQINNAASNASTLQVDAEQRLMDTYWGIVDDLKGMAQGTKAEGAFESANGIARAFNTMYDPTTHKLLVNAVEDNRGVKALIKSMINPNTNLSKDDIAQYLKAMGPIGKQEIENIGLRVAADKSGMGEMINNSMNVGQREFKIDKFLEQMEARAGDSAVGKEIYGKSIDALKGLAVVGKNLLQTRAGGNPDAFKAAGSGIGDFVKTSAAMGVGSLAAGKVLAGTMPSIGAGAAALAGGVAMSTAVMSKWAASQPLKQLLGNINNLAGKANVQPQLMNYLYQKANTAMSRLGIIMTVRDDGSVLIDKKEDEPKKKELMGVLGVMN
jgi:hypothetical protein